MKRLFFIFSAALLLSAVHIKAQEVTVIANKSVSEPSVTLSSLTSIFLLNKVSWSDGTKIKLFDQKEGPAKSRLYELMNKQEMEVKKQWLKKKLSEGIEEPKVTAGEDDVISQVRNTPGAIGYISKSKVPDDVKVLLKLK